jgi:uncharacterized protein HemY
MKAFEVIVVVVCLVIAVLAVSTISFVLEHILGAIENMRRKGRGKNGK